MSKQELIEKAVLHFGGKWIFPFKNLCTPAETNTFYAPHSKFESIRNVSELGENWIFICTEHEFNAAADRMRGKPDWKDAPEWAQWLGQCFSGNWEWYQKKPSADNDCFDHGTGRGCQSGARGKVIGDWRSTLEQRPEQKVDPLSVSVKCGCIGCTNNATHTWSGHPTCDDCGSPSRMKSKPADPAPAKTWFEAGDAPPAGTYCQVKQKNEFVNCYIVGLDDCGAIVYRIDGFYDAKMDHNSFRPIRTEREKAIEAAIPVIERTKFCGSQVLADELYDAGLLRLPDNKNPD